MGYFKGAIWWYDPNGTLDDIELRLQKDTTGSGNWVTVRSSVTEDNKEFVFANSGLSTFDGLKIRLRIEGFDVTSDDAGCGANSMEVYYAFFFEDEDRDDPDGPFLWNVDKENEH